MNRRQFLALSAASAASVAQLSAALGKPMGISIASYGIRWRARKTPAGAGWKNALDVIAHCESLGIGCLQIGVRGWQEDFAGKVRSARESAGLILEGQIALPKDETDISRFENEAKRAKEAGAKILRTVCLGGRRYETFPNHERWAEFRSNSMKRLTLAEPIMRKLGLILAVENHKDWRTDEFLSILRHFDSEFIQVNFDFGNNLSLLENPLEVAGALAPWIVTTHLKDMAGKATEEGFLLSEVPLGTGVLDLDALIQTCSSHHPSVQFNLEMITRDPLVIPCLKPQYWATMDTVENRELAMANTLAILKSNPVELPTLSGLDQTQQITFEEENVRKSLAWPHT